MALVSTRNRLWGREAPHSVDYMCNYGAPAKRATESTLSIRTGAAL